MSNFSLVSSQGCGFLPLQEPVLSKQIQPEVGRSFLGTCYVLHAEETIKMVFFVFLLQDSDPSSEVCTSQKSLQQKNYGKTD